MHGNPQHKTQLDDAPAKEGRDTLEDGFETARVRCPAQKDPKVNGSRTMPPEKNGAAKEDDARQHSNKRHGPDRSFHLRHNEGPVPFVVP